MHRKATMRAAVLRRPGEFTIEAAPVPMPAPNQVRVRIEGCGICGSNLSPWEGRPWFQYPFEAGAPGHEGWGEIDAVGTNVTTCRIGDRVAILSYHAFAEYDLADEHSVVRLPNALKKRPFPGEALGCAMNVFRRAQIQSGQTVAVLGVGFLGALLTQLSAKNGAWVLAISRRKFALDIAAAFGAAETIALEDRSQVVTHIKDLTGGVMCDCVIEAVGLQEPLDVAGELTKQRGRLVIGGYHQDGLRQVNMQLWNWRGIDVINAHERDSRVYIAGIQAAVDAVAHGDLDPSLLYTHTFDFDQISDGFTAMKSRPANFLKALVKL